MLGNGYRIFGPYRNDAAAAALFRYGAASARKPEILLSFFIERLGNAGGPRWDEMNSAAYLWKIETFIM